MVSGSVSQTWPPPVGDYVLVREGRLRLTGQLNFESRFPKLLPLIGDNRFSRGRKLIRIAHLITGLERGGAQTSLGRLVMAMEKTKFDSIVVALKGPDTLSRTLAEAGIKIYHLEMGKEPFSLWRGVARLHTILTAYQPHMLQGWMYHANLMCSLAAPRLSYRPTVIWAIRHSLNRLAREKLTTRWVIRLGAKLSRKADRIVYNAYSSAAQHRALGYDAERDLVIPNGVDCERFKPSREAREWLRKEVLGLEDNQFLVGMVARFHPMKGHDTFLKAAGMLARHRKDVKFVLVGKGMDESNQVLCSVIEANKVESLVFLLGERQHIESILPGLDSLCSSSHWGESFPNVVAEAMACGVPCVVTDVGDSARIVGNAGLVVPPGDSRALANALVRLVEMPEGERTELGIQARKRIMAFDHSFVVQRWYSLYEKLLAKGATAV